MEIKNCRTIRNVEIGQEIYLKPVGNARRFSSKTMLKAYVTRLGKKYFYAAIGSPKGNEHRFTVDGGNGYDIENNYGYVPYESEDAYRADVRYNNRMLRIKAYFRDGFSYEWPPMEIVDKIWDILVESGCIKEEEA